MQKESKPNRHWDETNEVVNKVGKYRYHYRRKDREIEHITRELCYEMKTKDKMTVAEIADHFEICDQTVARYLRMAKLGYLGFCNPKNTITVREANKRIVEMREVNRARIKAKREETLYFESFESEKKIHLQRPDQDRDQRSAYY